MKQALSFIICLIAGLSTALAGDHPEAHFGEFGLEHLPTIEAYQIKYQGAIVEYVPCNMASPSYDDERFTKKCKGEFMHPYIISKVSGNNETIKLELTDATNPKKKIKFQFKNQYEYYSYGNYTWCNTNTYQVPLFLVNEFDKVKEKTIGKVFTNPKVNFSVKVTDMKLTSTGGWKEYPIVSVTLLNEATNKETTVPYTDMSKEVQKIFTEANSGRYVAKLSSVEKPSNPKIRYGEKSLSSQDNGVSKFLYEDNVISIIIFATPSQFSFELKNVSDNTLKIIWDEAVIVDVEGSSNKVMHKGIKYSARNESQPASTIIKGSSLDDLAAPTDKVYYSEYLKEWMNGSMFPSEPELTNKKLTLMLPIQIKDVINEYIFVFDLEYVKNHPEWLVNN